MSILGRSSEISPGGPALSKDFKRKWPTSGKAEAEFRNRMGRVLHGGKCTVCGALGEQVVHGWRGFEGRVWFGVDG